MIYDVEKIQSTPPVTIGVISTNRQNALQFDISAWQERFPENMVYGIWLTRPGETKAQSYPVVTEKSDGILYWYVSFYDTEKPGRGYASIRAAEPDAEDGVYAKTYDLPILVSDSAVGDGEEIPLVEVPWAAEVMLAKEEAADAADRAEEAAAHYPRIGENGNWYVWDAEEEAFADTEYPARGAQGPQGAAGPQGEQGEKGDQGEPGEDAVIDVTLSHAGEAADAASTGSALNGKTDRIETESLWDVTENTVWQDSRRTEEGLNEPPDGAKRMTLEVVYGASVQGDDPSPEDPQEIRSVEGIHIVVHDADDVTVMERTITPPRPLNKIGAYADTLDVIGGVWKYALGAEEFNGTENWDVSVSSLGAYTFQRYDPTRFGVYADVFVGISNRYHYAGAGWSVGSVAPSDRGTYLSPQRIRILWASMGISTAAEMKDLLASWAAADVPLRVVAAYSQVQNVPVETADLAFLRSLHLLPIDHHIVMTDQDGNDVSYLMDYKAQAKPSYTASEIGYGQTDVGAELGRLSSEKADLTKVIRHDAAQTLTEAQKSQARDNIVTYGTRLSDVTLESDVAKYTYKPINPLIFISIIVITPAESASRNLSYSLVGDVATVQQGLGGAIATTDRMSGILYDVLNGFVVRYNAAAVSSGVSSMVVTSGTNRNELNTKITEFQLSSNITAGTRIIISGRSV